MSKPRQPGYYWLLKDGKWVVAEWVEVKAFTDNPEDDAAFWQLIGDDHCYADEDFQGIDPRFVARKGGAHGPE